MAVNLDKACEDVYYSLLAEGLFKGIKDKTSRKAFVGSVDTIFNASLIYMTINIPLSGSDERIMEYWKQKMHIAAGEWYEDNIESKRKKNHSDDDDDDRLHDYDDDEDEEDEDVYDDDDDDSYDSDDEDEDYEGEDEDDDEDFDFNDDSDDLFDFEDEDDNY